jgi:hypothetical protein
MKLFITQFYLVATSIFGPHSLFSSLCSGIFMICRTHNARNRCKITFRNTVCFLQLRVCCRYYLSVINLGNYNILECRSQWPRGLRRGSMAARLLGLWVLIPPTAWMSVSCECCELSGRGLCDELVTRPEESYRVWWF